MSFNYEPLASTAASLIKQFGREVVLRDKAIPTYDPATGNVAAVASVDRKRWAAIFDFGQGQTEERGNSIQASDKRAIMEAGVKPSSEDVLIDGSDVYEIVSVGELRPGSTAVMYTLHLRHG